MDLNGIVTVNSSSGVFADTPSLLTKSENPQVSASALTRAGLDGATAASIICIDCMGRGVASTDDQSVTLSGINGLIVGVDANAKKYTLTPDAGQSGRSLMWTGVEQSGFPAGDITILDNLVAAVKPTRTAEAMAQAALLAVESTGEFIAVIDQKTGTITIYVSPTVAGIGEAAIDGVVAGAGTNDFSVSLSEPPTDEADPLIFEGGETS